MDRFKNMFINPQDEIPRDYINVKQLWDEFLPKMNYLPGVPIKIMDHNMMPDDTIMALSNAIIISQTHMYKFLFALTGPTDETIKRAFKIAVERINHQIDQTFIKYTTNGNIT